MFQVFTFLTDTFQAPVLCHMANVLVELLVPIDFLNFFSDFDLVILHRTDVSYIRVTIEREDMIFHMTFLRTNMTFPYIFPLFEV